MWDEEGPRYRKKILDLLETRAKLADLRKHIVAERMITPADWAQDMYHHPAATTLQAGGNASRRCGELIFQERLR
jgi:phytoene dehydrogenase-like protein